VSVPRPSPDGERLLFVDDSDSRFGDLWMATADGRGAAPLHDASGAHPSWSPDGRQILFEPRTNWIVDDPELDRGHYAPSSVVALDPIGGTEDVIREPTLDGPATVSYPSAPAHRQASRPSVKSSDLVGAGRYSDGDDPLTVRVEAEDQTLGIERVGVVAGGDVDLDEPSCMGGCPAIQAGEFEIAADELPEGRHAVRLVARNAAGSTMAARRTLTVDRSAPLAATSVVASEEGGWLTVSWRDGGDPRLADGSPGSGVHGVRYRYKDVSDEWSEWHTAKGTAFEVETAAVQSSTPMVEIERTDRAGNSTATAVQAVAKPVYTCQARMNWKVGEVRWVDVDPNEAGPPTPKWTVRWRHTQRCTGGDQVMQFKGYSFLNRLRGFWRRHASGQSYDSLKVGSVMRKSVLNKTIEIGSRQRKRILWKTTMVAPPGYQWANDEPFTDQKGIDEDASSCKRFSDSGYPAYLNGIRCTLYSHVFR
jgi:hypothetical protein